MGTAVPRATTISSLCQVINCGLWLLYGTLKGDSTIMFVNSVGLLFGLYFVKSAYSILSSAKDADPVATRSLRNMIALAGTVLCALALYPFSPTQSMTTPMDLLGLFSSGLSVIMFGSPLSEMVTICRKGDASGMPLLQVATVST
jgi:solute carrier family 50 protein (sugar transporter)